MGTKQHITASLLAVINIAVNLTLTYLCLRDIFAIQTNEKFSRISMFCAVATLFGAAVIFECFFHTPYDWIHHIPDNLMQAFGKHWFLRLIRIIRCGLFTYCIICFAKSFSMDKSVYTNGTIPLVDCVCGLSWGILLNYDYLTYHLLMLHMNNGKKNEYLQ